jgi:chemotaxis protein CheD
MTAAGLTPAADPSARGRGPATSGYRSVYLHPGQVFASGEPALVTTVLGSCVSVCLWDPGSRVGGINHYLLPHVATPEGSSARFGNVAVPELLDVLLRLGARRRSLVAKVFGGACLTPTSGCPGAPRLGEQNVTRAMALLDEERIPVVGADTGGGCGRKLVFHTDDGSAWVRRL